MSALHTPERQPGETQAQYRERQDASRRAFDAITKPPQQAPAKSPLDVSRFWIGQHTNPDRNKVRHARRIAKLANGQNPKFAKPRKHKQHTHPLRDEHGAYTLVGARVRVVGGMIVQKRRKWLAGISAQRGY